MIVERHRLLLKFVPAMIINRNDRPVYVSNLVADWPVVLTWNGPAYVHWALPPNDGGMIGRP
jgi:hypothetical protein